MLTFRVGFRVSFLELPWVSVEFLVVSQWFCPCFRSGSSGFTLASYGFPQVAYGPLRVSAVFLRVSLGSRRLLESFFFSRRVRWIFGGLLWFLAGFLRFPVGFLWFPLVSVKFPSIPQQE